MLLLAFLRTVVAVRSTEVWDTASLTVECPPHDVQVLGRTEYRSRTEYGRLLSHQAYDGTTVRSTSTCCKENA